MTVPYIALLDLPNELLIKIATSFPTGQDGGHPSHEAQRSIHCLSLSCRRLHTTLTSTLYRRPNLTYGTTRTHFLHTVATINTSLGVHVRFIPSDVFILRDAWLSGILASCPNVVFHSLRLAEPRAETVERLAGRCRGLRTLHIYLAPGDAEEGLYDRVARECPELRNLAIYGWQTPPTSTLPTPYPHPAAPATTRDGRSDVNATIRNFVDHSPRLATVTFEHLHDVTDETLVYLVKKATGLTSLTVRRCSSVKTSSIIPSRLVAREASRMIVCMQEME
ncbi:hypothetical protein HKX48_005219 [Thoreauomyces humboldtii]|nr:hypothetical protein HKX48_005219 [Thoreauomyces humboldtii]